MRRFILRTTLRDIQQVDVKIARQYLVEDSKGNKDNVGAPFKQRLGPKNGGPLFKNEDVQNRRQPQCIG